MSFVHSSYWPRPVSKQRFFVRFNQFFGLMPLARWAVGDDNLRDVDPKLMLERLPLVGTDVRELRLRIEPCRKGETIDMTVARLLRAGHILEGTGELAGLLHTHHTEIEKWRRVFAVRQKMWMHQTDIDGVRRVSGASVEGKTRSLWRCFRPDLEYDGRCGIIVSTPYEKNFDL